MQEVREKFSGLWVDMKITASIPTRFEIAVNLIGQSKRKISKLNVQHNEFLTASGVENLSAPRSKYLSSATLDDALELPENREKQEGVVNYCALCVRYMDALRN